MIVPGHLWEEWPEEYFKFLRFRANSIRETKMKKLFVLLALLGTTLMAAERTGRRFRGLDIDPAYVDVAIERWALRTGLEPRLEGPAS